MGKTHSAAGCLFVAAFVPPTARALGVDLDPAELAIGVGIGAIAGVLPDIDHPDSLITHGLIPGSKHLGPLGKAAGHLLSIPPRIVGVGARATMNHRGGTHSALFMVGWTLLAAPLYAAVFIAIAFLASLVLGALAPILPQVPQLDVGALAGWFWEKIPEIMPLVMLSVFFGYLAHLVTDSMTNVPVPWPWPFSKARWSILPAPLRVTTDSFTENYLVRPLVVLMLAFFFVLQIGLPLAQQAGLARAKSPSERRAHHGHRQRTRPGPRHKSKHPVTKRRRAKKAERQTRAHRRRHSKRRSSRGSTTLTIPGP
jgi:membrane-bound metal-dependent hydrolase YbcI (DUF457 family)